MGIHDREYYRAKTKGGGLLSGEAPACKAIILANVVMFVGQKLFPDIENVLVASSYQIFHEWHIWQLITATFLHGSPLHILFNMLFLWLVGREMEQLYGTRDFAGLYLSAAAFSTFCWAVVHAADKANHTMLGASGAIMAVMVVFTMIYPRRQVVFIIIPMEMRYLLMAFLGYNILQLLIQAESQDAIEAHLGGAAYGYLFRVGDLRISRLGRLFDRKPRLRIVPAETREPSPTRATAGPVWSPSSPAAATKPSAAPFVVSEEKFDEKLDEILVKIAQSGRGALSEDENRVLEEASRRARNRRGERI